MTLINKTRTRDERGDDFYIDPEICPEALLKIENLPQICHDPCSGSGSIVRVIRRSGRKCSAADIIDRGLVKAFIMNQPFSLAEEFITHALHTGAPFIASIIRLKFLQGASRRWFFDDHAPTRLWISARRVAMHQYEWTGPKASPNWDWVWYVIDRRIGQPFTRQLNWFDPRGD
jgi:hypothetical protein